MSQRNMMIHHLKLRFITLCLVPVFALSACSNDDVAKPAPTGTAYYYNSLESTKLNALNYMKEDAIVHLGELVCTNLRANKNVMWIIKNIITLNGPNDGIDLSAEERYQFAVAVLASATNHLCPDMKGYVLAPHK